METDFLRLILFLAGIVVVLAIYFWERHKRVNAQVRAIRNAERQAGKIREELEAEEQWVVTDEYRGEAQEPPPPETPVQAQETDAGLSHELEQLSELVAEESGRGADYAEQMPLFTTDETDDPGVTDAESKVVVINIVSRRGAFPGEAILSAALAAGLEPGEMEIFHYRSAAGKGHFCMASMVEPGVFPLAKMEGFTTPGLALFLQISGGQGGLALYDEMLTVAGKLAASLDGELQDATHSTLTRQAIEFQRGEIVEFQRRRMLAKSNR